MPLIPQSAGGVEEGRHLRGGRVEQRGGLAGIGGSALADVVERPLDLGGGTERRVSHGAPQARLASGRNSQCVTFEGSTTIMRPSSRPSPMARYCGYFASRRSAPRVNSSPP